MRRYQAILFVVVFVLTASACAKKEPSYKPKRVTGLVTERSNKLLDNMRKSMQATGTLKALVSAELYDGETYRETDAALVVKRPDSIRVDAMDQLADVWVSLGTDGRTVWLMLPSKAKLYSGRASKKNLHKLAKFDFEMSELASVLLGSCPITETDEIYEDAGHFVSSSGIHIWTDKKLVPQRCARYKDDGGELDLEVKFSAFKNEAGVLFPHRIEAVFPARDSKIIIEHKNATFGGEVDESVFQPPKNRGTKVRLKDR